MTNKRVATYRLQINKDFTLFDAAKIIPYLKTLGVSDIYLSPIFEATKDSAHGYDIADFTKISGERGGEAGFEALNNAILSVDPSMKILLDIVPNHMGVAGENPFWINVLAKGRESQYWCLFDMRVSEDEKIHLPMLESSVEKLIESEKIEFTTHEKYGRGFSVSGRFLPICDDSRSKDLAEALKEQHYVLTVWTETFDKISYRRFFDITDLIGVRVEDKEVYRLSHGFIFELLRKYPSIGGVRVDHIDGLADPAAYLALLNKDVSDILVEKILARGETLPEDWKVQGTTGYEFIDYINRAFVDPATLSMMQKYWMEKIEPCWSDFDHCVLESKHNALDTLFSSELKRLIDLSARHGDAHRAEIFWRGMTAYLPVYRTYGGEQSLSEQDKRWIQHAADRAREEGDAEFPAAERIFLPRLLNPGDDIDRQIVREWQQLSGPAMAKGLEDTAHYRYTPLAALNEVGCAPDINTDGKEDYFQWMQELEKSYPHSLLATSTHDTKRSEDARHRLYALSDKAQEWLEFYETAVNLNKAFQSKKSLRPATEYFLYQAILAVWPLDDKIDEDFIGRIKAYMQKSAKEARLDTSWLKPDKEFEKALDAFIENILTSKVFLEHAAGFAAEISGAGAVTSLSVLSLKMLGGGVPDFYQGMEDWDFSLVDPDNRRPVEFDARADSLASLSSLQETNGREAVLSHLCQNWRYSGIKVWLTAELLRIRKRYCRGPVEIEPLKVAGKDSQHVIAYALRPDNSKDVLLVACPRYTGRYIEQDKITPSLDAHIDLQGYGSVTDLLSGKALQSATVLKLNDLYKSFPVIILKADQ